MLPIHLVAVDMDGTLLDDQKRVSAQTLKALKTLKERGIPAAFSTGRALAEMSIYPELTALVPYGILASGSLIVRMADGAVLTVRPCPPKPS